MAAQGIAGIRLRQRVRTRARSLRYESPRYVAAGHPAEEPNRKYVGDITFLPLTNVSNLYLATVIDCCSRASWRDGP